MPFSWLFAWWNAVYTIPLAVVLIFLTVTSLVSLVGTGLGELSQGSQDADVDADVDVDVDVDVDPDLDLELGVDLDGDGDIDAIDHAMAAARGHAAHGEMSPLVGALVLLGVGKAPLMLLLQLLVLFWGAFGLMLHQAVQATGPGTLLWSAPLTLGLSLVCTRLFASAFGKIFRPVETASIKRHQLVGRVGKVVYAVTGDEGTVNVRDQHGTLHRVRARTEHGRLESGQEIIVLGYDPNSKLYQIDDASSFVDRA